MTTPVQIKGALGKLDVTNDNHWTADGLPRLDTVKLLAGDQSITREALAMAAPGFTRASAYAAQSAPAATPEPEPIAAPVAAAAAPATETGDNAPDDAALPSNVLDNEGKAGEPLYVFTEHTELEDAQNKLNELRKTKAEADAAFAAQSAVVDALIVKLEKSGEAKASTPLAIQQYLASRREELQKRGDQIARVKAFERENGFKLADLAPKRAPIDTAMSRKNSRGAQRPVRG
jgi:hypothetical protein